jgi:microcystin-dependent protein
VIMWYGNVASIPTGWYLCDGTNGTPNLEDKFVVCAGSTYAVGDVGGAATVTLTEPQLAAHSHPVASSTIDDAGDHTHTTSASTTPTHTHALSPAANSPASVTAYGPGPSYFGVGGVGSANAHSHTSPNSGPAGDHTHPITFTVTPAGSGDAHENRPPYYALAYLMKA